VRIAPTPVIEAAPLWGFTAGTAAGVLAGLAAAFAGGPLGDGHLSAVGPSGFRVGLVAILEVGITAALAAAAANWLMLRDSLPRTVVAPPERHNEYLPRGQHDESDDVGGHRIYFDPWAGDEGDLDEDGEITLGLIEEYPDVELS
jgi:Family of unknown function (DUF6350)